MFKVYQNPVPQEDKPKRWAPERHRSRTLPEEELENEVKIKVPEESELRAMMKKGFHVDKNFYKGFEE